MATKKAFMSTYTYDCEMALNTTDGESIEILNSCVKYIMINHDYSNHIMPIIVMKVALRPNIYNKMVPDQMKGKIYLKIFRTRKVGSTSSTPKKVLYGEFDYIMTDDPNSFKKLDEVNDNNGTSYKMCHIGLVKLGLTDQNAKKFGGVYKNTNMISLVHSATSHMKMVIQPFIHNTEIKSFNCPTLTSVGQFLAYLNSKYNFYKGSYIYYMDFDKVYLRSNDGSYIDANDGDMKYIAFDIRDLSNVEAFTSGMVEDESQDAYIIYVQAANAQIIIDRVSSTLTGNISTVDGSGKTSNVKTAVVDTSAITNIKGKQSELLISSTNPTMSEYLKTRISETSDTLVITKPDMDSRIFTPNKQFLLSNYEDNPKYCGVYYMTKKQEIYLRNGDQMNCQMTITMKKCADYVYSNKKTINSKR